MRKLVLATFLFSFFLSCQHPRFENRNEWASFPTSFDFDELNVKAIAVLANPTKGTTSILFGNEQASHELKTMELTNNDKKLVLVTWKQGDDPHWFGAKIPGDLLTVEVLQTTTSFENINEVAYKLYQGKELILNTENTSQNDRIVFIKSIKPTIIP